jgi:thiamine-phosphate pyrophosphorylase
MGFRQQPPAEGAAHGRPVDWRLYVIIDLGSLGGREPLAVAEAVLDGGATVLQLRAPGRPIGYQVELATGLAERAARHGVPLIVNDHLDVALAAGAAGVHLGVADLPVAAARRIAPGALIGYSPDGAADLRRAAADGADYLGVGPFARTLTKADAGPPIGSAGLTALVAATSLPVVAVGGLDRRTIPAALAAGAAGVAVCAAILRADDPGRATASLRALVDRLLAERHSNPSSSARKTP